MSGKTQCFSVLMPPETPPRSQRRGLAPNRSVVAAVVGLLLLLGLPAIAHPPHLQAQVIQLTFSGSVYTNLGQTVAAGTPITVITTPTSVPCGQGVVGAAGSYSLAITTVAPCNSVGTSLVFQISGLAASPTAFVTTSSGTMLVNLIVAGLSTASTSAATNGSVITPPTSPPAGSATTPPALGGALIPPTTPPAQTVSTAGVSNTNTPTPLTTQPAASSHSISLPLTVGCSQVVVAFGVNAQPQQAVSAVVNPAVVLSIWHYDNASQHYSGYFPSASAASNLSALNPVDAVFVCVSADTTINAPQP